MPELRREEVPCEYTGPLPLERGRGGCGSAAEARASPAGWSQQHLSARRRHQREAEVITIRASGRGGQRIEGRQEEGREKGASRPFSGRAALLQGLSSPHEHRGADRDVGNVTTAVCPGA